MDFRLLFPVCRSDGGAGSVTTTAGLVLSGLEFHEKEWFAEFVPALRKWSQNVLVFFGQSNMGKSFFLKKLLAHVRPDRLYVILDTLADQYRDYAKHTKHYAVMPESIEDTDIQPQSYVIIDDIRVMNLKCGTQREALYKFFTMWSHHRKLNVYFLSQSFDNIKHMKVNTNFL